MATLLKGGLEKEWLKFEQNPQNFIQEKNLLTKLQWFLNKGWFSGPEILEIRGEVCCEEYEHESPTRIEAQNTENWNTTFTSTTTSMLSQKDRTNISII